MDQNKLPIVLLAGPTGVGKTELSLQLSSLLNTEIVNADSMQIYRHMDIGTAKPTPEERAMIPHHLLDTVDPDEPFDAARYLQLARPVVDLLHTQGKIPLIVGGTGLYMKVLTRGICSGPGEDPDIRETLHREVEERGINALHEELLRVDPESGERLHPNDRQRILRALEVYRVTGEPLSRRQAQHRFEQILYRSIKIALFRDREELYDRINRRVDVMMEQGFTEEVRRLLDMGYGPHLKSMQSLGYKQLVQYVLGNVSVDEAVQQIRRDTRRYAKRQLTWFRGDPDFQWFHAEDGEGVVKRVLSMIA